MNTKRRAALAGMVTCGLFGFGTLANTHLSVAAAQTTPLQRTNSIPGFVDSLQTITDLLNRGRGIEAENVARALLARIESTRGRDVLEVAEVLDLLGRAVRRSPRVTEEEKQGFAERALAIKEKVLGPWDPDVALSLTNLAIERTLAADPAAGRPLLERALAIREKAFGPDDLSVAATLQSLAGLLMTMRDDPGAKALLERALQIREMKYGAEHIETIQALFKTAIFYHEIDDYTGSRQRYERALSLAEKTLGASHPLVLDILLRLAVVLGEGVGDYAGAARLNERLLEGVEKRFGPADPRLRLPLGNLALDLRDLGKYAEAKTLAERSLAIAQQAFGPNHPEVADSLHTLATVLAAQGAYGEAMEMFERATQINEEAMRPSNPDVSRASWFIHDLFPVSGYSSDDAVLFEQAVGIRERTNGLADRRTAESLTNLAAMLSREEDFKRTRPLFERALASRESLLGLDHPEVAAAATNLAYVLFQAGDRVAAKPLYERALRIWEDSLGPDHPKVATALVNVANLDLARGAYDESAPMLRRALIIQQRNLGPNHPDIADTLSRLAEAAAHTGAIGEALETAAHAEEIRREHVRLTASTLSERQALAYAASGNSALDLMITLASKAPTDGQTSTAVWNAVVRARGLVLDEMATRHRVANAAEDPEISSLAARLASARQQLAAAVVRGIRDDPPDRYRRLLEQTRNEIDRAERDLASKSAKFREDQSKRRVGIADVSAALPAESALVGFVRYGHHTLDADSSYLAFVMRAGTHVAAVVPIGSASTVESLILRWRRQFNYASIATQSSARSTEAAYRRVGEELRRQVWDPLLPHLSNSKRVFVVPDGALHLVSFTALPTGGSRYLVETGPSIHYLSAERDVLRSEDERQIGEGLLALGGPAFDEVSPAQPVSQPSFRGARSGCGDFQSMRFDPLPASLDEVGEVVGLWDKAEAAASATRLTGAAATESAFKTKAAGHRVLHLATHGFFLGGRCASALDSAGSSASAETSTKIARENPLLLSGLILAGANRRSLAGPNQDDGVLTAEEVAALNLSGVEWAVLSGCDTGDGEVRAGEGVFGLRRAFEVAGARTVIMSLWPVEDQATLQWMTTLYEARLIRRLGTTESVREASLSVLRQRRARGLSAHPFYWAGFVAAGDWR